MKMVNLDFGGFVAANWGTINTVMTVYQDIATQYSLVKPNGAFNLEFNREGDLVGVTFNYKKTGIPETALQTFNDTWGSIATQYGIVRNSTVVTYYEGA